MARIPRSNAARRARSARQPRAAELLFLKVIAKRMALFNAAVEEIIFPVVEDIAASEERFITGEREDAFFDRKLGRDQTPLEAAKKRALSTLKSIRSQHVKILKAHRKRAKKGGITQAQQAQLVELESDLVVITESIAIKQRLNQAAARAASATTVKAPVPQFVTRRLETLEIRILQIFDPAEISKDLNVIGKRIAKKGGEELQRVAGIDIRTGIGSLVDEFRDKNVARITSLAGKELVEITNILSDAETPNLRVEVVRDQIRERFNVSKSRASLLARDQVLTLNANVAKQRQTNAGIEEYIWTTSGDERVRDEHEEREGKRFRWDTPPEDGHPGEPIQCRCTAFPVLPELA